MHDMHIITPIDRSTDFLTQGGMCPQLHPFAYRTWSGFPSQYIRLQLCPQAPGLNCHIIPRHLDYAASFLLAQLVLYLLTRFQIQLEF